MPLKCVLEVFNDTSRIPPAMSPCAALLPAKVVPKRRAKDARLCQKVVAPIARACFAPRKVTRNDFVVGDAANPGARHPTPTGAFECRRSVVLIPAIDLIPAGVELPRITRVLPVVVESKRERAGRERPGVRNAEPQRMRGEFCMSLPFRPVEIPSVVATPDASRNPRLKYTGMPLS